MTNEIISYEHSHSMSKRRRIYASILRDVSKQYGDLVITGSSVLGYPHKNRLCVYPRPTFEKIVKISIEECSEGREYIFAPEKVRRMERHLCGNTTNLNVGNGGSVTISESQSQSIGKPKRVFIKEVHDLDNILEIMNAEEQNFS